MKCADGIVLVDGRNCCGPQLLKTSGKFIGPGTEQPN